MEILNTEIIFIKMTTVLSNVLTTRSVTSRKIDSACLYVQVLLSPHSVKIIYAYLSAPISLGEMKITIGLV